MSLPTVKSHHSAPILITLALVFLVLAAFPAGAGAVTERWTKTFDHDSSDYGNDVAVAPDGSVYIVGTIYNPTTYSDIWLRKYSPRGKKKWTRIWDGGGQDYDNGYGVSVAPDGSVYVAGTVGEGRASSDLLLLKYSAAGKFKWDRRKDYGGDETAYGVAATPDGGAVAVGRVFSGGGGPNIWVRKYSRKGKSKWTRIFNHASDGPDMGHGVAAGPDGSVYVAGTVYVDEQGYNAWLRKYSSRGRKKWTRTYNNDDMDDEDRGEGVAVGPDGSVYLVGSATLSGVGKNILVRKYSSGGKLRWTRTPDGPFSGEDQGRGVAVGPDGGVYVTGYVTVLNQAFNIWTRKYSPKGKEVWTRELDGGDLQNDQGHGVAASADGSVYVGGQVNQGTGGLDIWLRKYRE